MPATEQAAPRASPAGRLASWARQGIESLVAAEKILLDLTVQQNALAIGMVRERLSQLAFRSGVTITKMADKGVQNFSSAGKILLDLATGETTLVIDGIKEGLRLPVAAGAMADVVRHRVVTLIDMQKHLMDVAAEQTHAVAESYKEGKGFMAAQGVAQMARQGIQSFVDTEKKFLDLAAEEFTTATKGGKEGRKLVRERTKVLTEMVREGVEKYIDTQKKLLNLAIHQLESDGKPAAAAAKEEPRTSFGELTQKSVHNIVTAEKALMDLAIKPMKAAATEGTPGRPKAATDGAVAPAKRVLSAAARRRIAAAQRKRWAAPKKSKAEAQAPKRRLSAAGRRAIIEATRKRWAAYRKAAAKKTKPVAKAPPRAVAQKAATATAS
jgi:hypothetical protein